MAYLDVRVVPRAHAPGLAGRRDGVLVVRLQSPPVDGAANAELIGIVAKAFGIARRSVTIVSGAQSRRKRLRIEGVTELAIAEVLHAKSVSP